MANFEFGKLMVNENGFPVLEVNYTSAEGSRCGYLSPFRGYCFQVSWTADGQGDAGASTVVGLKHCRPTAGCVGFGYQSNTDYNGIQCELLAGQAAIALMRFCPADVNPCVRYYDNSGRKYAVVSRHQRIFSEFIDACASWLWK